MHFCVIFWTAASEIFGPTHTSDLSKTTQVSILPFSFREVFKMDILLYLRTGYPVRRVYIFSNKWPWPGGRVRTRIKAAVLKIIDEKIFLKNIWYFAKQLNSKCGSVIFLKQHHGVLLWQSPKYYQCNIYIRNSWSSSVQGIYDSERQGRQTLVTHELQLTGNKILKNSGLKIHQCL